MSRFRLFAVFLLIPVQGVSAQGLTYPKTPKIDHIDDYFGTKVSDPFRWLEDDTASAVKGWVEAQNTVTFGYLEKIPFRTQIRSRLQSLYNYPRYGAPSRTGSYYVFSRNE